MVLKFNSSAKLKENISPLVDYYRIFTNLLDVYFDGFVLIVDDQKINNQYLILCNRIENLLERASISTNDPWKPFDNLYNLDPDAPEAEWEYNRKNNCNTFLSNLEKLNIKYGLGSLYITPSDNELQNKLKKYLIEYREFKQIADHRFKHKYAEEKDETEDNKQQKKVEKLDINDVFISHSKYDIEQAICIYDALTNSGLKCWMDKKISMAEHVIQILLEIRY